MSKESNSAVLEPKPIPIDIVAHQADLARRALEAEANRDLLYRCLDPRYAAEQELKKPQWKVTVECEWWASAIESPKNSKRRGHMEVSDDDDDGTPDRMALRKEKRTVVAQNEAHAWALFCDAIQCWPSPRLPGMTRKFKRSKDPVAVSLVLSMLNDSPSGR